MTGRVSGVSRPTPQASSAVERSGTEKHRRRDARPRETSTSKAGGGEARNEGARQIEPRREPSQPLPKASWKGVASFAPQPPAMPQGLPGAGALKRRQREIVQKPQLPAIKAWPRGAARATAGPLHPQGLQQRRPALRANPQRPPRGHRIRSAGHAATRQPRGALSAPRRATAASIASR